VDALAEAASMPPRFRTALLLHRIDPALRPPPLRESVEELEITSVPVLRTKQVTTPPPPPAKIVPALVSKPLPTIVPLLRVALPLLRKPLLAVNVAPLVMSSEPRLRTKPPTVSLPLKTTIVPAAALVTVP